MQQWIATHADQKELNEITAAVKKVQPNKPKRPVKSEPEPNEVEDNWRRMKTFFGAHR